MTKHQPKVGFFKRKVLNWLDVPGGLTNPASGQGFLRNNAAGQTVNENTAITISAVYACTRLISDSIGTLPLHLYERTAQGRERVNNHGLSYMLSFSPNASSTPSQFWSAMVTSLILRGNALAEIKRSGGRIVALEFLHPDKLKPVFNEAKQIISVEVTTGNKKRVITRLNILHIPFFSLDGEWGISAIQYGAGIFGGALAATASANDTFEKGLAPKIYFKLDRILSKKQREEFRESLQEVSGAMNAGRSPLLEAGMEAEAISINPKDAQLLESREFSVAEVCSWFGVDPSLIGRGTAVSNWGTGLEQKTTGFLTFTLRPIMVRIEQAINKYLLAAAEQQKLYSQFAFEGLLRTDSQGRGNMYKAMIDSGIMTRDEARELENLPRKGGNADKLTIQMGFTTIDNIGAANEQANFSQQ